MVLESVIAEYGIVAGALVGMFYLAKTCSDRTRKVIEENTQAVNALRIVLTRET